MPYPLKKPLRRMSNTPLNGFYGPDSGKRIVITLVPGTDGDLIELRPEKTRRAEAGTVNDIYRWLLERRVSSEHANKRQRKVNRGS